nr:immunoglobulin light chain junction region [Macaca mulatta]MOX20226.1 immunoglobulin light chain junction region [Macaca mulatta]MOX21263.1 immunoglobulin light chain junction region [Macaca mulatta]MOX21330.1 immunoglobulin light chain junction region [Macaca mulatta]MOX22674.1 immunoglobulin light chain junction region [Macaca mulatta]
DYYCQSYDANNHYILF